MYVFSNHQREQIKVIEEIEKQVKTNSVKFSLVSPTRDFDNDPRICLTSVHIPNSELINKIQQLIIKPIKIIDPDQYYYQPSSMHMTIKNVRIINDPPKFGRDDIYRVQDVFNKVIPKHKKFEVYFYRLLIFPSNLALIGTTDPELDSIMLELDRELNAAGVPDDKTYTNNKYFFSNMTLARFTSPVREEFKKKVKEISQALSFEPYIVDSVSLITCNAIFMKRRIINTWKLI